MYFLVEFFSKLQQTSISALGPRAVGYYAFYRMKLIVTYMY